MNTTAYMTSLMNEKVSTLFLDSFDDEKHAFYTFKHYSKELGIWIKHKPMNYIAAEKYRQAMIKQLSFI